VAKLTTENASPEVLEFLCNKAEESGESVESLINSGRFYVKSNHTSGIKDYILDGKLILRLFTKKEYDDAVCN